MADLVVGMAKTVVDGALTKAQAATDQEVQLLQRAQCNLVFITSEFKMMRSFLNVADGDRLGNPVMRTWVQQLRDLAYDVEDCIEFVVYPDKKSRWWLRLLHPARWLLMPCLEPHQLDEAVAELDRLKARVEDMSARNARYCLINDSGSKQPAAVEQQPAADDAVRATAFDRIIVAASTQKASLTHLLSKKESGDLRVISVWGSGGDDVGMTSILWEAYIDEETCKSFACRAWVKLRQPFNPHEFIGSLTAQFFASTCQKQAGATIALDALKKMVPKQDDFIADFAQHVNEKRFLIVLEGLSTMEEWNAITTFFPKGEKGSYIIVSTVHFEVASLSVGYPYRVLQLNQLPDRQSVHACFKLESQHDEHNGKKTYNPVASRSGKKEAAKKWMEQNPLFERDSEIKDLEKMSVIAANRFYRVMSVWGAHGVGKSVLVKHIFCQKICTSTEYNKYAWVNISHRFNLWNFSRSLLFNFNYSQDIENTKSADTIVSRNPIAECREMLRNKNQRCFIVIDGLQSKEQWDLIQDELVLECNPGTFIIVIASEESIATHCCGSKAPLKYNVKVLEPDAALRLFNEVSKKPWPCDSNVLRELVAKCGGLPKVITEIARMMTRMTFGWMAQAKIINKNFIHELKSNGQFCGLQGLLFQVESYLRNCPDYLKPCIFYLSIIFSPRQLVRRRRIIRRWIAEGYSADSYEKSAAENGEKQFFDLLMLGIIQQTFSLWLHGTGMISSCHMNNGFLREYIISQRMENNHVFELDGNCTVSTQRTGRHLVISESWERDKIVFESIDHFSKLRSLTVSGKWESFFISKSMKLLRVLDLEDARGVSYSDLVKIVKCFPRLKFLSLRGLGEICHLPRSIGDLRQLQTLDVRSTSIITLPVNTTKLQSLRYIRAGTTASGCPQLSTPHLPLSWSSHYSKGSHIVGIAIPPGIGKLTKLHTLGVVNVSASGTKAILQDLKRLTQLRKLGVSGINTSNSEKFFSAISVLVHLESLSVRLDKDNQGCLEGIPLPLGNLKSLKLHGLGDKLPAWSAKLTMLIKIDLEMDKMLKPPERSATLEDGMMFLGMLPQLCILRVCAKQFEDNKINVSVRKTGYEEESYKNLKIFQISCSSNTDLQVTFGLKTMKLLEQLKVDCSSRLEYLFDGLTNLPELKEVCLMGPNANTQKEYVESLLNEHENRPVVKLE